MKNKLAYIGKTCLSGFLIVVPLYLAVLLLLKGMKSVVSIVRPFALLLPEWFPAEKLLSLLFVLLIFFIIGALVRQPAGRAMKERVEKTFFERIPGYSVLRSLTLQVAGDDREKVWKPALVEIEDALVPAFIIEKFDDSRYTVFVPSIPTPFAGAVYVLDQKRVHPVEASFTDAIKVVSRWGAGAKDLVAEKPNRVPS